MSTFTRWFICILMSSCALSAAECPEDEDNHLLHPIAPTRTMTTDHILYDVAPVKWTKELGNQRLIFSVPESAKGKLVRVDFPWRRHDINADNHTFIIQNLETGKTVDSVRRLLVNNERCLIEVGPISDTGLYAFYYLPYTPCTYHGYSEADYGRPTPEQRINLGEDAASPDAVLAQIVRNECRLPYDNFAPMEICATAAEKEAYIKENLDTYYIFCEDRLHPIKMLDEVPSHWMTAPQKTTPNYEARRNEYYCFQVAIWSPKTELNGGKITFDVFKDAVGNAIKAMRLTCFNTEIVDAYGVEFTRPIGVKKGGVQTLWVGIDVSDTIPAGVYRTTGRLRFPNDPERTIEFTLTVLPERVADRGDAKPEFLSRLRWLNSARFRVAPNPEKQHHIQSTVEQWQPCILFKSSGNDTVHQKTDVRITDNTYFCSVTLTAQAHDIVLDDVSLFITAPEDSMALMTGMGYDARKTPDTFRGGWDADSVERWPFDSFWTGTADAGLHVEMRGGAYHGPMLNLYRYPPPAAWYNDGRGGFEVSTRGGMRTFRVFSGPRTLKKGEHITFEYALMPTPVKKINWKSQFTDRYFHGNPDLAPDSVDPSVRVVNVHHANAYNPIINYPFITEKRLKNYVKACHAKGLKVKLYYTVRELTSALPEFWALRSFGHEILADGRGGGAPHLREHVGTGYRHQWYAPMDDALGLVADEAVMTASGDRSRWLNYYVEGLHYMVKNYDIDGVYMDDVTFGRDVLARMRNAMDTVKSGCMIDLHSNTGFSIGPSHQYTEFFPYVDKLWFGESFRYNQMSPEAYLVDCSGIVFGLTADMLQDQGNRFLGLLYGMTCRYPQGVGTPKSPLPIWRLWDTFGIANARVLGYWDTRCPVTTDNSAVLATVYETDTQYMIVLGNFSNQDEHCKLTWKIPMSSSVTFDLPFIEDFQSKARATHADVFMIPAKQARVLIHNK